MVELRFHLHGGGSADLAVAFDDDRLSIPVLDHTDVLGDLAAAVVRVAEGSDRTEVAVLDDHHEHLLSFERRGRDGVVIEILRTEAPRDLDPGAPERVVLSSTCSVRELLQAMSSCLDAIVLSHGVAGYEAMWTEHPFPRELRRRLIACAGRRKQS